MKGSGSKYRLVENCTVLVVALHAPYAYRLTALVRTGGYHLQPYRQPRLQCALRRHRTHHVPRRAYRHHVLQIQLVHGIYQVLLSQILLFLMVEGKVPYRGGVAVRKVARQQPVDIRGNVHYLVHLSPQFRLVLHDPARLDLAADGIDGAHHADQFENFRILLGQRRRGVRYTLVAP